MSYTPVELRHVRVARGLLGYKRGQVEQLLLEVADSFEEVWRERGELEDRVELLEKEGAELRRREELLAGALVAAEEAAKEMRDRAKREAELVVAEAHQEARAIARGAHSEHARLLAEVRRMEALLRSALGLIEESGAADAQPEKKAETWPRRDDTREFPRPVRRVTETQHEPEARAG